MLSARDLTIVGGDKPTQWRWISLPESRFSQAAKLLDVSWLEVRGKIKTSMLSPNTTYSAFLMFTTSGVHGFDSEAIESTVGISGPESETRKLCLDPDGFTRLRSEIESRRWARMIYWPEEEPTATYFDNAEIPKKRDDRWTEVLLGEFHIEERQDCELEISLTAKNGRNSKRGLIIEGIEIRPKES